MKSILLLSSQLTKRNTFACRLSNSGADVPSGFKLCFSFIAPGSAISNCEQVRQVGGYLEINHPENAALTKDSPWEFEVAYSIAHHRPLNVSWGPEGAHVLTKDGEPLWVTTTPTDFGEVPLPAAVTIPAKQLELALVPTPKKWQASGNFLPQGISFSCATCSEKIDAALADINALAKRLGSEFLQNKKDSIKLECSITDKKDSYRLEIATDKIKLDAANETCLRLGLLSFVQLRLTHTGGIPCGVIEDSPRFDWRGMHFDCARHFYTVPTIKRYLDLLALLKFNRLHWHLTEDEAFRLELDCYPELIQTCFRGHDQLIPGIFGGGAKCIGGSYSKSDVKEVITHANSLGIAVMPEVELPAHCWSILQVMPELRDPNDASNAHSVQGYLDNTLNPAMPKMWEFLEKVLPEIAEQFGPGCIHLGGDEVPPGVWTASPALEKFKAEHNLKDPRDVLEWTMKKAAGIIANLGGNNQWRPATWADAAGGRNGGIGHNSLVFAWQDYESGLQIARNGYDVVMCPAQFTYLDMAPDDHPSRRGMNWAALIGIDATVSWEPVPKDEPELAKRIVGVEGALWSETILNDQMMEPMIAPRILGIAETAWATPKRKATPQKLRQLINAWQQVFGVLNWEVGSDA